MIVVDTSVLVDLFRGKKTKKVKALKLAEKDNERIALPAVCIQKVLQGSGDEEEWRELWEVLRTQEIVVPDDPVRTHVEAARIYFDARRKGITLRGSVDCFIAALVIEKDAVLLADDKDFERIAQVRPLRLIA